MRKHIAEPAKEVQPTNPASVEGVSEGICEDAEVMNLWRKAGLPEYFLGNGGTNHKLVDFANLLRAKLPTPSQGSGERELPPLDVTDEERTLAMSLTEEEWLAAYAMASPIELAAIRYCRERQLKAALAANAEKDVEIKKLVGRREHTQNWYASHYGKLEDWARKVLPEPWRNQFFSCIANGTYSHTDVGEPYMCNAGFMVTPSGYIPMNDAKGQLIRDQTTRAEEAEAANAAEYERGLEDAAKFEGEMSNQKLFEQWWKGYLSNRTLDPFPTEAAHINAKQAAWAAWHYPKAAIAADAAEYEKWIGQMFDRIDMAPNDDPIPYIREYVESLRIRALKSREK